MTTVTMKSEGVDTENVLPVLFNRELNDLYHYLIYTLSQAKALQYQTFNVDIRVTRFRYGD